MTIDADSLPGLETRLKEQQEYDQPRRSLDHYEGPEEILQREACRDDR